MNPGKTVNALTFGVENYGIGTTISYVAEHVKASLASYSRNVFSGCGGGAQIYIIYLQYTGEHQDKGLAHLRFVTCLLGLHQSTIVIVDNSISTDYAESISDTVHLIGGDNSCYDFSGYDKGVEWLKSNNIINDSDIIVLCNDSFFRNYGHKYLKLFSNYNIIKLIKENLLIGYTDSYPYEVIVFGKKLKSWVRTNFYIMNANMLNKLIPLTINISDSILFSENYSEFFSNSIDISENYKQYLRTWLFGEECTADYKSKWHAHSKINCNNFEHFKKKVKCIFSEHYLSAKALEVSRGIVSVNEGKVLSGVK